MSWKKTRKNSDSSLVFESWTGSEIIDVIDTVPPTKVSNLKVVSKTDLDAVISWNKSPSLDIVGYEIYKDAMLLTTQMNTTYEFTGLTGSTTYSIAVKAKDNSGLLSTAENISLTTPAPEKHLFMNGTTDRLQLPSITMDSIELEILVDETQPNAVWYYFDSRTGLTNGFLASNSKGVGIQKVYVDNILAGSLPVVPKSKKTKIKAINTSSFTDDITIFSNNIFANQTKGRIFKITCYLTGQIAAQYDMSTGTVQDQSGNGKHATLTGGTWI